MEDTQARLGWLIEQARLRPLLPPELRIDTFRIEGCLARLWLVPEFRAGHCYFRCESDSLIVKAVAGLLSELYSGRTPKEILAHSPTFFGKLGLTPYLTANRRNGLILAWEKIREFAAKQEMAETQRYRSPLSLNREH